MSKERTKQKNKKNLKSILNILWTIIFIVLAVGSITINNIPKLQLCLTKQVELQDYYTNFLWPELCGKVNLMYAIIVVVCGLVYFKATTDLTSQLSDRSVIHIKNISIVITAIAGGIYGAVGIFYFKSASIVTVVIGLAIVLALVTLVANLIQCSRLAKEESVLTVIKPVIVRLIVLIATIGVCGLWLLKPLPEMKKNADKYYNGIYNHLMRISFGHKEGVGTNRALLKYEFVRRYSDSGREYDLEQLEAEYSNFLSGEGSWSNLWYFCHDSIDIELKSQQIDIYKDFYPYNEGVVFVNYNDGDILYKYYNIKGRRNEEKDAIIEDKLGDVEFFCVCVEEELNSKWLTISQEGDSTIVGFGEEPPGYKTATEEEVLAACDKFEADVESADGSRTNVEYGDSIDISMELSMDKPWKQLAITEKHDYAIGSYYIEIYNENLKKYQDMDMLDADCIEEDEEYKVTLYVKLPTHTEVAEHIDVNVEGVNAYYKIVKHYNDDEQNYITVEFRFTTKAIEDTSVDSITVDYKHIRPGYHMYDVEPYDTNPICTIDSMEWSVYDVKTGALEPYAEDTFSEENLCYVAAVKIIPDADVTFDEVEYVNIYDGYFFEEEFSVPEYDEKLHAYTAGSYPRAYYEKHLDDAGDYIMLYLPYYRAETKGEDPRGDVYSMYGIGKIETEQYIYVIEGSKVKLEEKSAIGAEVERYEVKKPDGTLASEEEVKVYEDPEYYNNPVFIMPAYPIEITGYY